MLLEFSKSVLQKNFLPSEHEFVNLLRGPGINSQPGRIDSLESIPGLIKRLQIRTMRKGNTLGLQIATSVT